MVLSLESKAKRIDLLVEKVANISKRISGMLSLDASESKISYLFESEMDRKKNQLIRKPSL
jgi:hypothetical protein